MPLSWLARRDRGLRRGPREHPGTSHGLAVFVENPDAHCERATAEGAKIVSPPADTEFGARGYMVEDLEGRSWFFADYRPGAYWDQAEG